MTDESYGFNYNPENLEYEQPLKSTLGYKFSGDIFLLRSFLDKHGIEYKEEDLEDSPIGRGIRIKREKKA